MASLMGPSGTASAASLFSVLLTAALFGHSGAAAGPPVNFSALPLPSDFLYSRSGMNSLPPSVSNISSLANQFK
jgi:hypothetical protein